MGNVNNLQRSLSRNHTHIHTQRRAYKEMKNTPDHYDHYDHPYSHKG
jgi:hypothetical protein